MGRAWRRSMGDERGDVAGGPWTLGPTDARSGTPFAVASRFPQCGDFLGSV